MYFAKGDLNTKLVGTLNNANQSSISHIPYSDNNKRKIEEINSNLISPAKRQKIAEGSEANNLNALATAGISSSPQRLVIHAAGLYIQTIINGRLQTKIEWRWIAYEVNSREEVWFVVHP